MREKIEEMLKIAYNSGYEDGVTFAHNNIKCNDFQDVLFECSKMIDEICVQPDKEEMAINGEELNDKQWQP
ncbi:MAG: hypothetical protein GY756_26985 [bacterium]|nr:hypothetical protein [bacterium]